MILLADSGSTKTHWALMTANGHSQDFYTAGINPVLQSPELIQQTIDHLLTQIGSLLWAGTITNVFFYGAGCTPEKKGLMRELLAKVFKKAQVQVESDMLGAARGLLQREQGIACILGTGSGSCFYDGEQIAATVPSLGFILGDEGSGATLGKRLVSDALKNQLPMELKEALLKEYNITQADVIDRVYRQPMPNRFLAELSQFCARHIEQPAIRQLVYDHFDSFVKRNLLQYEMKKVSFVGSIAFYYKDILEVVLLDNGLTLGTIMKDPIEGLKTYHQSDLVPTL
ncbi:MAG: ATPase [Paludibacteraceae bacterium]|nr:ATPase [Paludibacteraceae bacterium]